jgi:histidinol-phosphatase
MSLDLARALDVARSAVEAASRASMVHFERGVLVEKKTDRSPVTAADRDSEAAILSLIRAQFPTHRVLAEESGVHPGDPDHRWIVDPLDGTRGFSRGGAFWGPLVAYEYKGEICAGAMALPVLGETYWAALGMGAFKNDARVRVSTIQDWSEATLSLGEMSHLMKPPFFGGVVDLVRTAASTRGYGDPGGCAMLLQGRCEAWLEAGVKTWDLAPQKILVEEAGGRFTDLGGATTIENGNCIATNGRVHDHVLAVLARSSSKDRSDTR